MKPASFGVAFAVGLFLISACARAQESGVARHAMATNQLKRIAADMSAQCLEPIQTLEDWETRRPQMKRELLDMLGLDPLPTRTPLRVRVTGRIEHTEYTIEKVVFQSLPGLYVTGNLYLPAGGSDRRPTILYLCGHSAHPLGAKVEYQDRALWFATHGFVCLVLDTLEFGEVAGIHHGTHNLNQWWWVSLGYTPAGVEVWNAMRALDYLETRPEVDAERIGMTGISGGGAITWYTAAVDDRVAVAAPVCSTFTFGSQAAHWIASGQCDCIYYCNTYGWDFPVVAALIAPRPLMMISGRRDSIFPPDGYHEVFRRAKRIYDLYAAGDSDRIGEVDDDVGHSDPPKFLREAREWMRRWLRAGSAGPLGNEAPAPNPASSLACLTNLPADAVNYRVPDGFLPALELKRPVSARAWERRRVDLVDGLRRRVFRWFPEGEIPFQTAVLSRQAGYLPKYAEYEEVTFQTEGGVKIRGQLLTPAGGVGKAPLLIYVKRRGDSIYAMDTDELLPLLGRRAVLIIQPRFTELSMSAEEITDVERTAVWVGRTMASMQVWDLLRAVKWAREERGFSEVPIALYGKGEMGVVALYAGLLDGGIQELILRDPPVTHRTGPALLNVLRVTDLPEVLGAWAPRRLVLVGGWPPGIELAERIYRMKRASERLQRAGSLPEALEVWKQARGGRGGEDW